MVAATASSLISFGLLRLIYWALHKIVSTLQNRAGIRRRDLDLERKLQQARRRNQQVNILPHYLLPPVISPSHIRTFKFKFNPHSAPCSPFNGATGFMSVERDYLDAAPRGASSGRTVVPQCHSQSFTGNNVFSDPVFSSCSSKLG